MDSRALAKLQQAELTISTYPKNQKAFSLLKRLFLGMFTAVY